MSQYKNNSNWFSYIVTSLLFVVGQAFADDVLTPAGVGGPDWGSGARTPNSLMLNLNNSTKLDSCLYFPAGSIPKKWADLPNQVQQSFNNPKCGRYVFSLATMPSQEKNAKSSCQIFSDIAHGAYDKYYELTAGRLASEGAPGNLVIRFGWEQTHKSFPWTMLNCRTSTEITAYKAAYARIVQIFRTKFSNSLVANWSFTRDSSKLAQPLDAYYPGSTVIDVIGLDYYDNYLDSSTVDKFKNFATKMGNDRVPIGIQTWADFAKRMGKPIAIDEWAVWNDKSYGGQGGDNPAYIQGMYWFFSTNKPNLAYEMYFNSLSKHLMGPGTLSPKAGAMYKSLWK